MSSLSATVIENSSFRAIDLSRNAVTVLLQRSGLPTIVTSPPETSLMKGKTAVRLVTKELLLKTKLPMEP